ncbi:hypothetical protein AAG587_08210 [Vreelandella neptunia]|uniref:hypothetical protein n=1 Tax=Vreelandella neptunia TaxID=115551 RepID=UPI00315AE88D
MECECRADLEAKLKDHVTKSLGEGYEDFDASLQGYGFGMDSETLTMTSVFLIPFKGEVMVPNKNGGGMKRQKVDTSVRASFCPFCGKSTEAEKAA